MSIIHTHLSSSVHPTHASSLLSQFVLIFYSLRVSRTPAPPPLTHNSTKTFDSNVLKTSIEQLELGSQAQYNHVFMTERVCCNTSLWHSCCSLFASVQTLQSCQCNCVKDQGTDGTTN